MASPDVSAGKTPWRRFLRRQLAGITDAACQSEAIRHLLTTWLADQSPLRIATFAPLPGEPDLTPLLARFPNCFWHFPRVNGCNLSFHPIAHPDQLQPGAFGIAEPAPDRPETELAQLDLILCPGLAFSVTGSRLGRGKGFYDRALAEIRPDTLRVGIAFREQLFPDIPTDPHDRPMTHLATPDGKEIVRI